MQSKACLGGQNVNTCLPLQTGPTQYIVSSELAAALPFLQLQSGAALFFVQVHSKNTLTAICYDFDCTRQVTLGSLHAPQLPIAGCKLPKPQLKTKVCMLQELSRVEMLMEGCGIGASVDSITAAVAVW